jgi:hypothetical protein
MKGEQEEEEGKTGSESEDSWFPDLRPCRARFLCRFPFRFLIQFLLRIRDPHLRFQRRRFLCLLPAQRFPWPVPRELSALGWVSAQVPA